MSGIALLGGGSALTIVPAYSDLLKQAQWVYIADSNIQLFMNILSLKMGTKFSSGQYSVWSYTLASVYV